ncbi:MAG: KEOPS complex subunit Cgi121 [Thermoplasmata archaeon]
MEVIGVKISETKDSKDIFEDIECFREQTETFVQIFDHSKVVSKDHLLWAHQKAEENFEEKTNRADNIEIETLLWSSGEWQIKDAIDKMGIEDRDRRAVVLLDSSPQKFIDFMSWERDDSILEVSEEKLKAFGIDEKEIESVDSPEDLVFEKMATSIL